MMPKRSSDNNNIFLRCIFQSSITHAGESSISRHESLDIALINTGPYAVR
jgi:hypothetical protein